MAHGAKPRRIAANIAKLLSISRQFFSTAFRSSAGLTTLGNVWSAGRFLGLRGPVGVRATPGPPSVAEQAHRLLGKTPCRPTQPAL